MKLDKFLKILWLVNGIGLLIIFIIALGIAVSEIDFGSGFSPDYSEGYEPQGKVSLKLEYDKPESIHGTENYLLPVGVDQYERDKGSVYSDKVYYSELTHACVNVIFLDKDLHPLKTLLDRKAFISRFSFPSGEPSFEYDIMSDTTAKNMVYLIALHDTNEDGTIDYSDESNLYISDLSGNNFQQITKDIVVSNFTFIQHGRKLRIDYLNKGDLEGVKHFALYNIAENKLENLSGIDNSLNSIKSLYKP